MKAWEFGLRVRTCSDDFSPCCVASRSGGRIWRWKGREAVCRLAIQGRVSQNLRLIQVIFGHTASEESCVSCLSLSVCVCVRNACVRADQAQAEIDGEFHSGRKLLFLIYSRTNPNVSTSRFQSGWC